LRLALTHGYELVILDLLMPGTDGVSVLRQVMRARPEQAVLVLSCLSDVRSKVLSLSLGAEDYLGKPFHVDELLARVLARLRAAGRPHPTKIVHGPVTLDLLRRRVDIGTRSVTLSEREFLLFGELLRAAGKPVSKDQLLARCWGFGFDSNVVDVCVRRLRKHLGEEAITTVRGQGYCVDMA
jgi:DNA-binding response OmpR family regulator